VRTRRTEVGTEDDLLGTAAAARVCGVKPMTLASWRLKGYGPAFLRLTKRCVRYRRSELLDWLGTRLVRRAS
jgi:hypothetical protein